MYATIGIALGIGAMMMLAASWNEKWVPYEAVRVVLAVLGVLVLAGATTFHAAWWRRCLVAGFKPLSPVHLVRPR